MRIVVFPSGESTWYAVADTPKVYGTGYTLREALVDLAETLDDLEDSESPNDEDGVWGECVCGHTRIAHKRCDSSDRCSRFEAAD